MWPGRYFAKAYFAGTYFPPVEGDVAPLTRRRRFIGGGGQVWLLDDEEVVMLLIAR